MGAAAAAPTLRCCCVASCAGGIGGAGSESVVDADVVSRSLSFDDSIIRIVSLSLLLTPP